MNGLEKQQQKMQYPLFFNLNLQKLSRPVWCGDPNFLYLLAHLNCLDRLVPRWVARLQLDRSSYHAAINRRR
jgi:hypothetical protein